MGKPSFSDEFKRDAVARITERGGRLEELGDSGVVAMRRSAAAS